MNSPPGSASAEGRDEIFPRRASCAQDHDPHGGAARLYAEPGSVADLRQVAHYRGRRYSCFSARTWFQYSSVPDAGVDGLVTSLGHETWSVL